MIEGGGWSSSSRGNSIQDLAAELAREYTDKNITLSTIDHRAFMDGLTLLDRRNLGGPVDRAAIAIEDSNHWPVVIVGHSLGAHTAYRIAQRLPVSLLVTLDGVSLLGHGQHLPHPGNDAIWLDVDAAGDSPGPDWNGQKMADVWVTNLEAEHSDVKTMFDYAKKHVDRTLKSCPESVPSWGCCGKNTLSHARRLVQYHLGVNRCLPQRFDNQGQILRA